MGRIQVDFQTQTKELEGEGLKLLCCWMGLTSPSVVLCRNFLYGFFWDCILKLCTRIGYSEFNCGGKKHLHHFTFVSELLGIGFLLHLLLTLGSVAPWPFLLDSLFHLKTVLVLFLPSHLGIFHCVCAVLDQDCSLRAAEGLPGHGMVPPLGSAGGCWGLCGALSDMQIWFVFCHKRGILSTLKTVGKDCHVRGNISVII